MKLKELFEMSPPRFEPRELPTYITAGKFYSRETLERSFDVLVDTEKLIVAFKKDRSLAAIGAPAKREMDDKPGMEIYGTVEFKEVPNLSPDFHVQLGTYEVQVDGVEIAPKFKTRGYGFLLYFTLINAGFAIICDNVQYLGGKALWKKVAKQASKNNYQVVILDKNEVRLKDGKPEIYDGENIDDCEIWSLDNKHLHTLLMAHRQA